jgi:hypothetical protein
MTHQHKNGMFIRVPLPWFMAASRLPGKASVVAQLIRLQADLRQGQPVKLATRLVRDCSISRGAMHNALEALETAGLISVERRSGSKPTITVIELDAASHPTKGGDIFDDLDCLRTRSIPPPRRPRRRPLA